MLLKQPGYFLRVTLLKNAFLARIHGTFLTEEKEKKNQN